MSIQDADKEWEWNLPGIATESPSTVVCVEYSGALRRMDGFSPQYLPSEVSRMDPLSRWSRRSALKSALALAGAACAGSLTPEDALAQQKVSKEALKYQDKPNGDQKCSNCMQFEPPGSCKVVDGKISPDGYCIAWVKKA